MNITITSKEEILKTCKALVIKNGIQALSIREVAKACGIATGSVYNYFPSKSELVTATIQEVWQDIFKIEMTDRHPSSFLEYVAWIFEKTQLGAKKYPHFFTTHALALGRVDKEKGVKVMEAYFSKIENSLYEILEQDVQVREDCFTETFTKQAFAAFVFSNLMTLILQENKSSNMLIEVIRRTIY